jgi:16S rRNA (cytidine1402-2'-O)-methyltransferase
VSAPVVVPGTLYVVATPIGNLGDITYRAVDVLRHVDLIVAEDTRHSRTLLAHYEITTPSSAYHEHNEARESPRLVARLREGASIALVTDAGTPLVSDPGARLVRAAVDAGVPVVPIPGASALLAALVGAALPADAFTFVGFLPRKGQERDTAIARIARSPITTVLYESPQRVEDTLADLADAGCAERQAVIARELTKRYEEFARGTVAELRERTRDGVRGEVVLLIAGAEERAPSEDEARALAAQLRADGIPARAIVERLTSELGLARNAAYRLAHEPRG